MIARRSWLLAAFAAVGFARVYAKPISATPFADNMVLQCEMAVPVWGVASPNETVTVAFAGQTKTTNADEDGKWRVTLDPMAASKEDRTLSISGADGGEEIRNVLVGEVWFASGQSNMECPIWGTNPRFRDANGAMMIAATRRPFIRFAKNLRNFSRAPRTDWKAEWRDFSPDSFKAPKEYTLSAVAFYYALELYGALDIPVGVVDSSCGGSCIDTWIPASVMKNGYTMPQKIGMNTPTALWNGMVAAWAPMAMRGFIWYQGCNEGWRQWSADGPEWKGYCAKMHMLYNGWSKEFRNPGLKLYFAQLAPFSRDFHAIRLAQAQFAAEEKNAAMSVTCDVGNMDDIHPNRKEIVAKRLALHALKRDYGFADIIDDSPSLKEWRIKDGRFVLSFDNATSWYVYNANFVMTVPGFEVAGSDGKFVAAKVLNKSVDKNGTFEGHELVVAADGVTAPCRLRYLATAPYTGSLYAVDSGLPLGPFEIDTSKPGSDRDSACAERVADDAKTTWIGDGRMLPENDVSFYAERPASEFRSTFVCPKGANLPPFHMAAAGYYTLTVNGCAPDGAAEVSLMPLWSPYDKTIYVDEHPIPSDILKPWPETNEVRVVLGNGFYNLPPLRFWGQRVFRHSLASGEPVFILSADGVSFSPWEWRETDIVRNCVYLGTEIDRSRELSDVWRPAVAAKGPKGRFVARKAPPVGVRGVLKGESKWLREGSVQVVDFGENNTGVPSFLLRGKRGTRIEIVYGERLNADGSVNVLTQTAGQIKRRGRGGPGAPDIAAQRDVYVCLGAAEGERFAPPFTWHVCRYAEVRGLGSLLADGEVELRLVSSLVADAKPGAGLKTGDGDLDRIHDMCRRTFLANLVGVQSDCPGRERLGYGGDIVATCDAYCLNFDMREFYLKTLQDFADEAENDGWITETAPYVGISSRGFGGRSGPISWALGVPVLMDALLRHYGDERALAYYDVCARYARLVAAKCPNGTVERCIGDHEALERAPDSLVATAHWHEFLRLTVGFAERLGREKDAAEFRVLAEKARAAFVERWVKSDGTVGNGTQSAQAFGFYLGLVPEPLRDAAFAKLVAAVEAKDCAPTTGIFATRYMLMALSENGRIDLARRIVLQRGGHGWMHMLDRGATTLWETWKESDDMYSNCHPMFGSVDEWIVRFAVRHQ